MSFKSFLCLSLLCNPIMAMIVPPGLEGDMGDIDPSHSVVHGLQEHEVARVHEKINALKMTLPNRYRASSDFMMMADSLSIMGAQLSQSPNPQDRLVDLRCDLLEWVYATAKERDSEDLSRIAKSLLPLLSAKMTGHQRLGLLKILKGANVSELPSLTTPFKDLFQSTTLRDDQYAGCLLAMKALPSASRTIDAAQQIVTYFNAPQHLGILQICEDHIAVLKQVENRNLIDVLREAHTHITPEMNGFNRKKVLLKVLKGERFEETTTADS